MFRPIWTWHRSRGGTQNVARLPVKFGKLFLAIGEFSDVSSNNVGTQNFWTHLKTLAIATMKQRCLPACLIVRNVCLILALVAGSVVVAAEMHASANQQQQQTKALRQLFVYQILLGVEQEQP